MNINFSQLKLQSRLYNNFSRPLPLFVGGIFAAVSAFFYYITTRIVLGNFDLSALLQYYERFMDYAQKSDIDAALAVYDKIGRLYQENFSSISSEEWLIVLAAALMGRILTSGFKIYSLAAVHNDKPCYGNLLDGFSLRIIAIDLISLCVTALGFLVFFIPGVVLFYAYRQAIFIAADDPEKGVFQCLRESRLSMRGNKFRLFTLDVSFLAWIILSSKYFLNYAAFIAMVWVRPYMDFTYALYYDALFHPDMEHRIDPPEPRNSDDDLF